MYQFVSGAFVVASLAVALFFWTFYEKSGERLFALLSAVFALFGVERGVLAYAPMEHEGRHWIYVVRLVAYLLLSVGILQQNARGAKRSD